MASGINFKIYDPVAQLVAGGGSGGLAPGAAAANINTGPAGAINASQIAGAPFLPLAGGTMTGQIVQPLAPVAANDLANKAYVDAQVSAGTPDATTTTKGKIQLAGDLGGTAAAPVISNNAVTYAKMQNTTQASLLGSSAAGPVSEIAMSPVFSLAGNNLSLTPTFNYNVAGRVVNTPFSVVRNAYVSYTFDITGITTSISGELSINTPINTQVCQISFVPPAAGTPFDYRFTLSGFVPPGVPLELTVTKDGVDLVGLAPTFSEEVLF
ncbi:hypothetical protein IIV25_102L [Invertebrate iridovirus 25]|uniref:Uncharacterized protein n=1 Tax=Invertebrate iridovirus 25 TaxID=1301280 RepID=W8W2F6_9VIRU|nr:hypothetical protein IIV25_102L [Invertebrate iridovirus 25]CCV02120.1 hypothetical protein IIV25_102L [Invertebrate iridovirus 25]